MTSIDNKTATGKIDGPSGAEVQSGAVVPKGRALERLVGNVAEGGVLPPLDDVLKELARQRGTEPGGKGQFELHFTDHTQDPWRDHYEPGDGEK
jgi:hypothetical protein